MRLILASSSPRRQQLMGWAGYAFGLHVADVDETWDGKEGPVAYARRLAIEKAMTGPDEGVVLAADTVVHQGGRAYGKPSGPEEASQFLHTLAGDWHEVTTGVCARSSTRTEPFTVTTRVRVRELTSDEIEAYVASGEPLDKAGAYAIQGRGGALVAEVQGSWTNVMGLPMERTIAILDTLGVVRGHR